MKLIISTCLVILCINAQEAEKKTGWQEDIVTKLDFSQSSFSNWKRGGEDALAWQFQLLADFKNLQDTYRWATSLKMVYGQSKIGTQDVRNTTDQIKFESIYSLKHNANSKLDPYVSLNWLTQFSSGFDYDSIPPQKVSSFMDPGYLIESIGYKYAPDETFNTRIGFSAKQTFTKKFSTAADDVETIEIEDFKNELGLEWTTDFKDKISENILLKSKLEVFSNMETMEEIDVSWDTTFSSPISKLLNVSFNFELFYDSDFNSQRQLKQIFALGFVYDFL